jgi:hypothetical protein
MPLAVGSKGGAGRREAMEVAKNSAAESLLLALLKLAVVEPAIDLLTQGLEESGTS